MQDKPMSTIAPSWSSSSRVHVVSQRVQRNLLASSARNPRQGFTANPSLSLSICQRSSSLSSRTAKISRNKIVCNISGVPTPSGAPSHSWRGWMIGMLFTVFVPFLRHKWGPLQLIKNKVDTVMNTVEAVAEVVEAVAHKVEEVADGIADNLPEGGKLKTAFEAVEAVAKEAARDAHMVDQLIENVEAAEDKVEDFFESTLHGGGDEVTKVDGVGGEKGNIEEKKIEGNVEEKKIE